MKNNICIGTAIVTEQEGIEVLDGCAGATVNFAVRCTEDGELHPTLYQVLDDKGLDVLRVEMVERWTGQYAEDGEYAILVSSLEERDGRVEIGGFHLFESFEDD